MSEIIYTNEVPEPIGPYSQAIKANGLVFVSGQLPFDSTGELVANDVSSQTKQVLKNIGEILYKAGSEMGKVVKTTIYLKNMDDFSYVNDVYSSFFSENPPARETVEVARLPKDVKVEISCIAVE